MDEPEAEDFLSLPIFFFKVLRMSLVGLVRLLLSLKDLKLIDMSSWIVIEVVVLVELRFGSRKGKENQLLRK